MSSQPTDWPFPSIHHSLKQNHILTPCIYSAHSQNLINSGINPGQKPAYSTCTLTPCAQALRDTLNASTWLTQRYALGYSTWTHGAHVLCTHKLHIWNQQVYFPFLFTGLSLGTSSAPAAVAASLTPSHDIWATEEHHPDLTGGSSSALVHFPKQRRKIIRFVFAFPPLIPLAGGFCSA